MKAIKTDSKDQKSMPVVSLDEPLWQVWRTMKKRGFGVLPVVHNDRVIGVVRSKDLSWLINVNCGTMDLRDVLHAEPICVHQSDSFRVVIERIVTTKQDHVVVLDDTNGVTKILGPQDIIQILAKTPLEAQNASLESFLNMVRS